MTYQANHTRPKARRMLLIAVLMGIGTAALLTIATARANVTTAKVVTEAVQELEIKAMDYAFEMAESVRPGLTRIRLTNAGKELHHVWLVKIDEGKTMQDLFGALRPGTPFPSWARNYGGPNASAPGVDAISLVNLEAGKYAVVCFIPGPDGKPHIMKGMVKELIVAGEPVKTAMPKVDVEAKLTDYDFVFSTPIKAGRQTIRFVNDAGQPHEAFIARLAPGAKAADFLEWLSKMDGPPPAMPMGGITGIDAGGSIVIEQTFEPGRYALYCFVPDDKDGKEHVQHGMLKEFTVAAR